MIYFDNAATTPMSEAALTALIEVSNKQYGNASSLYKIGRESKRIVKEAREIIANCIGAKPNEIFFTSCGTESDNWVISQAESELYERVIVSSVEHHAILKSVEKLQSKGKKVIYIPVNEECIVRKDILCETLDNDRVLVSIMFQNNETGAVQPIRELCELVHKKNPESIFHTDAVQAVGHTKIDVKDLGVDMLSASAHKFNGPKGIGFLYVREGVEIQPFICGGGQEFGLRAGTENVAAIYSMAKALEENNSSINATRDYIRVLEKKLLSKLDARGISYKVNGEGANRKAGIINISIAEADGEGLLNALDLKDICVSIGSACNSENKEPSHVLTAMGCTEDQIDSSIRISIGKYNTLKDIEALSECIVRYNDAKKIN